MRYNCVVIGAGVSGMTASLLLARQGRSVALVERAPRIAPTIGGFAREGVWFDTGFHYAGAVAPGDLLAEVMTRLGLFDDLQIVPYPDGRFDRFREIDSGFEYRFTCPWERLQETLTEAFSDQAEGIAAYINACRECWEQTSESLLAGRPPPESIRRLQTVSLESYLRGVISDPRLIHLLSSHCLLYGSVAHETPAFYHFLIAGSYYASTGTIVGGGRALTRAFRRRLRQAGVAILTGDGVEEIHVDTDRKVTGVRLHTGQTLEAVNCIATMHPKLLGAMLPAGSVRPAYRNRLQGLTDTLSAYAVYGTCETADLDGIENLILAVGDACMSDPLPESLTRRDMFVSLAHSETERTPVTILCPAAADELGLAGAYGHRDASYPDRKAKIVDTLCDHVLEYAADVACGFHRLDGATPLTIRDYTFGDSGGLYGVKRTVSGLPLGPVTRVRGLYLSGQSTLAPGVLGSMLAAMATVRAMDDRKA